MPILRERGVDDAFKVRRELVNYKKVCLNMGRAASQLDRDMRQLVTFFRGSDDEYNDDQSGDQYFTHSTRHTELNDHLGQCKGALGVVSDLRQFIKTVCCVPRHPGKPRPESLRGMPHTLKHLRKFAVGTRGVLDAAEARATATEELDDSSGGGGGEGGGVVDKIGKVDKVELEAAAAAAIAAAAEEKEANETETDGMAPLRHVMEGVEACGWPAHFTRVVMQVLIAKGAAKALWMHKELKKGQKYFAAFLIDLRDQLEKLERQPTVEDVVASDGAAAAGASATSAASAVRLKPLVAAAMRAHRQANLLTGAIAALADQVPWLTRMAEVPEERLFVAGDDDLKAGTCMFVPRGFTVPQLFDGHRAVADRWRPKMRASLAAEGWPAHLRDRLGNASHETQKFVETTCRICDQGFSSLWVHRSVCIVCELDERQERGRCPYRTNCASPFCPHSARCFVCDAWSCGECQLIRGDGEDVAAMALDLQPDVVFLDFDRTLCTTRGGGSPLVGSHTVDPDLMSLVCNRPVGSVHIVTRNSYREDIKEFLRRSALPDCIPIHTVKKHQSKAEVVCDPIHTAGSAAEGKRPPVVLFVDDSVAEHLDARLEEYGVHRVLFGRAL